MIAYRRNPRDGAGRRFSDVPARVSNRRTRKVTIRKRIALSFSVILLIMLAIGGFAYSRLSVIEQHALSVKTDAMPGLRQSGLIRTALAADQQIVANQFVQQDPKLREQNDRLLASSHAKLDDLITDYRKLAHADGDRQQFARFESAYADYRQAAAALLARPLGEFNLNAIMAQFTQEFDPKFKIALKTIENVSASNHDHTIVVLDEIKSEVHSLLIVLVISSLVALVSAALAGRRLWSTIIPPLARLISVMDAMRQGDFTQRMEVVGRDELSNVADGFNRMADEVMELVGQVQRSGIRVSASMTEIAATSKQQQATATEVAATTTQIGATSREIAATSKELVRTITDVATVAEHAAGLATSGQSGLAHMEQTMGQVMEAASSINSKLAVLNDKAGDINQVVTTITKVADQTNLLSLNAAIEAEKAGEYGRGFAVVSSEIRRLADQTAVATYDIEQMVKEIQSAVSAGVMGMDKFSEEVRRGLNDVHEIGGKLSEIIAQVLTLVPRFETVSEGMHAQATGAEQISEALVQLTEATQQTVESLRQSSSAIDELNQVSGNLHGSIARFKLAAA